MDDKQGLGIAAYQNDGKIKHDWPLRSHLLLRCHRSRNAELEAHWLVSSVSYHPLGMLSHLGSNRELFNSGFFEVGGPGSHALTG